MKEGSGLTKPLALVEQTRDQPGVQSVGLGLLAQDQLAALVHRPVLQPIDLVAVGLQPGHHGP